MSPASRCSSGSIRGCSTSSSTSAATCPQPLIHTGSTSGPASTGAGDVHAIYMVAMPEEPGDHRLALGQCRLRSGGRRRRREWRDRAVGRLQHRRRRGRPVRRFRAAPVPGVDASFDVRGGNITSDLFGFAVTDMRAGNDVASNLDFTQDVSLFAGRRAHLFAGGAGDRRCRRQCVRLRGQHPRRRRARSTSGRQGGDLRQQGRLDRHRRQCDRRCVGTGHGQPAPQPCRHRHRRRREHFRRRRYDRDRRQCRDPRQRRRRHPRPRSQRGRRRPGGDATSKGRPAARHDRRRAHRWT